MSAAPLLMAQGLSRAFGGLRAVENVDLSLRRGEIHALIGPNGAGKSTLVGLLSGRIAPDRGQIFLHGQEITRLPAHLRVRQGLGYTFQITSIFPALSVFDNVALAAQGAGRQSGQSSDECAFGLLTRLGMQDLAPLPARALSYGHQRMLELAMGLALAPDVLILDEPTQGLASGEIENFQALLRALMPDLSILLIEHNMELVMALADRITVLVAGEVLARGTPAEIRANPLVQEAYLGA